MLFNSEIFFALLTVTLLLYWVTDRLWLRKSVLLSSSIVFYAYWFPPYVLVLIAFVAIGFVFGSLLYMQMRRSRLLTSVGIGLPLAILAYYKYRNYVVQLGADALSTLGFGVNPTLDKIYLPLGISFIAFQLIGYIVDVRRGKIPPERNFLDLLLFKAYFPQLIAGPICRGSELLPQLKVVHQWNLARFMNGLAILAIGFFLKVTFADNLAPYVDRIYQNAAAARPLDAFFASLGFSFQILADFWGYSTMAVGMSQMFGIAIPVNFNLPYSATSIREFWRRWHITLSNWLRDYLYIPLGGSRHGQFATGRNLFITMLLGGLWHGAATTFVIWGAIHGTMLTAEHFLAQRMPTSRAWQAVASPLGWIYTMAVVFFAWVFFRAATTNDALSMIGSMARIELSDFADVPYRVALLVAVFAILSWPLEHMIRRGRKAQLGFVAATAAAFWMFALGMTMASPDPIPFIYFQF